MREEQRGTILPQIFYNNNIKQYINECMYKSNILKTGSTYLQWNCQCLSLTQRSCRQTSLLSFA